MDEYESLIHSKAGVQVLRSIHTEVPEEGSLRQSQEAKEVIGLAFLNGLIEDVRAGKVCPACCGSSQYSKIKR